MAQKTDKEQIDEAVASKGTDTLPDSGWKRDEVLKRRQANLDEEAEELAEKLMIGAINEKYMQVDQEIVQRLDYLSVTGGRDDMYYCWANYVNDHGHQVLNKKMVGYEVVTGTGEDCPECLDLVEADGTRRIGDVLLMRIPREHALVLKARERAESLKRRGQFQNAEYLQELGRKYGIKVHTNLSEEMQHRLEQRAQNRIRAAEAQVRAGYRMLGKQLEGGRMIPGVQIPGLR